MNWLIIAAGGNGQRIKLKYNKIFAVIKNKPIIYWTLRQFEDSKTIGKIIISVKSVDFEKVEKIIKKANFKKVFQILPAEKSRQESTFKALKWLKGKAKNSDLVGVHNAVNLFVSENEIKAAYQEADKYGASLLAYPAKDTVKISNGNGQVDKTPLRQYCWSAQTPQVAAFGNLWKAFVKADRQNFIGTDDTQLLERIGIKSKIVPCSNQNFKITFQEDLLLARQIFKLFHKNV